MQNYKKTRHPQNKLTFFCFAEARQPSRKIPRKKGTPNTSLYLCLRNNKAKKLFTPRNKKARNQGKKHSDTGKTSSFPLQNNLFSRRENKFSHRKNIFSQREKLFSQCENKISYSQTILVTLPRILFVKRIDKVKPYLLNNHFLPVLYVYPLLAWFAMLLRAIKSVPSIISILVSYACCRCSRQRIYDRFWFPYLE